MRNSFNRVKMLLLDVDGVLTDGKIMLDKYGEEYKFFNVKDGEGINIARQAGIIIVFLSGRKSKAVKKRAEELGVEEVYQGVKDKVAVYEKLLKKYGLAKESVAYVGDDLNDVSLAKKVGSPIAVSNAAEEMKKVAAYVTSREGGNGAVREAIEFILKKSGKWKGIHEKTVVPSKLRITAVIPARYHSTRLKGKPLIRIAGKPLVQHVYERVKKTKGIDEVVVATDDKRIYTAVLKFGGRAEMTSTKHETGSDRIAEVVEKLNCDVVINVQCDEPLVEPEMLEQLASPFFEDACVVMSTLKTKIKDRKELENPNVVKVITDREGNAIYFSRSPIPHAGDVGDAYKHIGLYAYRKDFLLKLSKMKRTPLEKLESLEQLRALENDYKIRVVETEHETIGVDTPEDLKRLKAVME